MGDGKGRGMMRRWERALRLITVRYHCCFLFMLLIEQPLPLLLRPCFQKKKKTKSSKSLFMKTIP